MLTSATSSLLLTLTLFVSVTKLSSRFIYDAHIASLYSLLLLFPVFQSRIPTAAGLNVCPPLQLVNHLLPSCFPVSVLYLAFFPPVPSNLLSCVSSLFIASLLVSIPKILLLIPHRLFFPPCLLLQPCLPLSLPAYLPATQPTSLLPCLLACLLHFSPGSWLLSRHLTLSRLVSTPALGSPAAAAPDAAVAVFVASAT